MTVEEGLYPSRPGGAAKARAAADPVSAVREALRPVLSGGPLDVLDVGGGTGHYAVPLAGLGHRVTVVDPNPDALAILERRAAEAGVAVHGVQGDAADVAALVGPDRADLVLCHSVLEYLDDVPAGVAALVEVTRPGGTVSLLVPGALGAVLHRAAAGRFAEARKALTAPDGRWGDRDPVPRRFTRASLLALAAGAGLAEPRVQGVRVFGDLVPGAAAEADPRAAEALAALEADASTHPVLADLAASLHLAAVRPARDPLTERGDPESGGPRVP
ncbi:class I SAM-dependent methyltransferase [Actinocorallia sp. A-T 12471]|uniref:class I SAM-dependent methyltransferase n=1 Tax=Actinocorallia sp. A-T 12471 TaxID=3089813 RepID=UPI0029CB9F6F|nr:methyltransferase domain-containing protein [Actinocorallia sp. A-T 12471]MDX6743086.1 methyltransferase domain-containing protein [Actinocorallia sp. A-T 12471]